MAQHVAAPQSPLNHSKVFIPCTSAMLDQSTLEWRALGWPRGYSSKFLHSMGGCRMYLIIHACIAGLLWVNDIVCAFCNCCLYNATPLLLARQIERSGSSKVPFPAAQHSDEVSAAVVVRRGGHALHTEATIDAWITTQKHVR
jgi:hypothetical protein